MIPRSTSKSEKTRLHIESKQRRDDSENASDFSDTAKFILDNENGSFLAHILLFFPSK